MFVIMPRSPLSRYREKLDDGAIIEVVVWDVPMPVVGSRRITSSIGAFMATPGGGWSATTTSAPKGDHRHYERREEPYPYERLEKLIEDFFQDVQTRRTDR